MVGSASPISCALVVRAQRIKISILRLQLVFGLQVSITLGVKAR